MDIEYFTFTEPETDYRNVERHFRTRAEALATAEKWLLAHSDKLRVRYWDAEPAKRAIWAKHKIVWPQEAVHEVRIRPETLKVNKDDELCMRLTCEYEIRWLRRKKETTTFTAPDGKAYSREDTIDEEIEPWQPWVQPESWGREKPTPVWGCLYATINHTKITLEKSEGR